jgi:hypothetical protein
MVHSAVAARASLETHAPPHAKVASLATRMQPAALTATGKLYKEPAMLWVRHDNLYFAANLFSHIVASNTPTTSSRMCKELTLEGYCMVRHAMSMSIYATPVRSLLDMTCKGYCVACGCGSRLQSLQGVQEAPTFSMARSVVALTALSAPCVMLSHALLDSRALHLPPASQTAPGVWTVVVRGLVSQPKLDLGRHASHSVQA